MNLIRKSGTDSGAYGRDSGVYGQDSGAYGRRWKTGTSWIAPQLKTNQWSWTQKQNYLVNSWMAPILNYFLLFNPWSKSMPNYTKDAATATG